MYPALIFFTQGKRMARLNKKQKDVIFKVATRWAHTLSGTRATNLDRVRELFAAVYPKTTVKRVKVKEKGKVVTKHKTVKTTPPKLVQLKSPIALLIAQAVLRGRFAKKDARVACNAFNIDSAFINELTTRDTMLRLDDLTYGWRYDSSPLFCTWRDTIMTTLKSALGAAAFDGSLFALQLENSQRDKLFARAVKQFSELFAGLPQSPAKNAASMTQAKAIYALQHNDLRVVCSPTGGTRRGWGNSSQQLSYGNFAFNDCTELTNLANVPWSSNCVGALRSRMSGLDPDNTSSTSVVDAEVLCALLGAKDNKVTQSFELLHEVSLSMTFAEHILLCTESPTIKTNANGELHCEDGPAVFWSDGAAQYYIDGHALGQLGRKIVERPETLTLTDINQENNEEVKRIAIQKYGWGRYLDGIGARVIDRRENWVDNTVEALVTMTEHISRSGWNNGRWSTEPVPFTKRKMILSCRSTGRLYFPAMPENMRTCEEAQAWMAAGANTDRLSALNRPVRLVGAS